MFNKIVNSITEKLKSKESSGNSAFRQFRVMTIIMRCMCPIAAIASMVISYNSIYVRYGSIDLAFGLNAAMLISFCLGVGLSAAFFGLTVSAINLSNWKSLSGSTSKPVTVALFSMCLIKIVWTCSISFQHSMFVGHNNRDVIENERVMENIAYQRAKLAHDNSLHNLQVLQRSAESISIQIQAANKLASQFMKEGWKQNGAANSNKVSSLMKQQKIQNNRVATALNIHNANIKMFRHVGDSLRNINEASSGTTDVLMAGYIEFVGLFSFAVIALFTAFYRGNVYAFDVGVVQSSAIGPMRPMREIGPSFSITKMRDDIRNENGVVVDLNSDEYYLDHYTFQSGNLDAAKAWLRWRVYTGTDFVSRRGGDTSYVKHRLNIPEGNKQIYNRDRLRAIEFMKSNPGKELIQQKIEECESVDGMLARIHHLDQMDRKVNEFHMAISNGKFKGKPLK